jgi:hypothetical protein
MTAISPKDGREDYCVLVREAFGLDWTEKTAWVEDWQTVQYAYLHFLSLLNKDSNIEYAIGKREMFISNYSKADNDKAKGK